MDYHTMNSGKMLLVFGYQLAKESDLILEIVGDETEQAPQVGTESVRATDNEHTTRVVLTYPLTMFCMSSMERGDDNNNYLQSS